MSQWWQWWCLCLCCHREQHERIFESRLNDVENKMASSLQSVQESCAVLSSRVTSDSQVIAYLRAFACSIQIDPCTWSVVEKKLYSKKTEISKKWQDQFCCIFSPFNVKVFVYKMCQFHQDILSRDKSTQRLQTSAGGILFLGSLWLRACVRVYVQKVFNTRYLINCLQKFRQIHNFGAVWHKDELISFWGQKSKVKFTPKDTWSNKHFGGIFLLKLITVT